MKFTRAKQIRGEVTIPGDKSISHRAVMFGSLAEGATEVTGFLRGADVSPPSTAPASRYLHSRIRMSGF